MAGHHALPLLFSPAQETDAMLSHSTIERYFEALRTHDGPAAAALFAETGAIDDFRGRHHSGTAAIASFIGQVPPMDLTFLSRFIEEDPRVTVYGRITYSETSNVLVRWVFTAEGDRIGHLCNSRVELVPTERQS
jgi:hypothetical protein